jgi:hypothetical protein
VVVGLTVVPSLTWAVGIPTPGHPMLAPLVPPAIGDTHHVSAPERQAVRVSENGRDDRTPVSVSSVGTWPAASVASGVPTIALMAYQRSTSVVDVAVASCHLDWTLLAAVGQVESGHGRAGGSHLDADGVARPPIVGLRLDGRRGTSRVRDTDAGHLDGDPRYDHAVGPMQFLPSTWSAVAVDGDQDGQRRVQDIDDAALGSAVYLCAGGDDLGTVQGQQAALLRYNHSAVYVAHVLTVAREIRLSAVGVLYDDVPQDDAAPRAVPEAIAHHPDRLVATIETVPHATATISPVPVPSPTWQPPVESPTSEPTSQPTSRPTEPPSETPTSQPTTSQPTASQPTAGPTDPPTTEASNIPTDPPTTEASEIPTTDVSDIPSMTPSATPVIPSATPPELAGLTLDQVTQYDAAWAVCAPYSGAGWARDRATRRLLTTCLTDELAIERNDRQLEIFLVWAARFEDATVS